MPVNFDGGGFGEEVFDQMSPGECCQILLVALMFVLVVRLASVCARVCFCRFQ